jgi:rhodanese-related sulfurtransferase
VASGAGFADDGDRRADTFPRFGGSARVKKTYADFVRDALTRVKEISAEDARRRFDADDGVVFLDVREGEETARGVVPGAACVPRGVLEGHVGDWIPSPATEVVVYCAAGNRSALAADVLGQMGFSNVRSLAGGFRSWVQGGNPVAARR